MNETTIALPFLRTWAPFLYLYGVGGIIFFIGMFIIFKAKSINLSLKKHRQWFAILFFGYFYYLGMHFFLTYAALNW
jgi:hypothetical protein